MAACVADREVAFEIRTPDRVGRGVSGQTLGIRHAVPTAPPPANQSPLPQDVPDRAGDRPSPRRVLPSEDRQQFARPPPWVAATRRDNQLDRCCGHGVRMGQRRTGPIDERHDAGTLIALHPFIACLPTNAGALAQDTEGLVPLQVPGDELPTFITRVSLIPWHAAACRSLLPMSPVCSVT